MTADLSRGRSSGHGPRTDEERRARARRFIRENHPDRGGDPEAFAAGLAALRSATATDHASGGRGAELRFHRRRGTIATLVDWLGRRGAAKRRPPRVT
jgi:hypothetical protein